MQAAACAGQILFFNMRAMQLYNSRTLEVQEFIPVDQTVRLYVCGITPYDATHLGHANTYLAFAAMIAAGLDGVEKGLELAEPVEESLFEMDAATIAAKSIRELPGTLGEALDELEKDDVIREALGDHVFSHFVDAKRAEWDEYRTQVSDWEVERYLEAF